MSLKPPVSDGLDELMDEACGRVTDRLARTGHRK